MCGKKCSFSKPVGFTVTRNNRLRRLFRRNKRSRGVFQTRARSLLELQPTKHCWNGLKHESMWVKWQFQSVWDGKLRQKRSVTVLAKRRWLKARHVVGRLALNAMMQVCLIGHIQNTECYRKWPAWDESRTLKEVKAQWQMFIKRNWKWSEQDVPRASGWDIAVLLLHWEVCSTFSESGKNNYEYFRTRNKQVKD